MSYCSVLQYWWRGGWGGDSSATWSSEPRRRQSSRQWWAAVQRKPRAAEWGRTGWRWDSVPKRGRAEESLNVSIQTIPSTAEDLLSLTKSLVSYVEILDRLGDVELVHGGDDDGRRGEEKEEDKQDAVDDEAAYPPGDPAQRQVFPAGRNHLISWEWGVHLFGIWLGSKVGGACGRTSERSAGRARMKHSSCEHEEPRWTERIVAPDDTDNPEPDKRWSPSKYCGNRGGGVTDRRRGKRKEEAESEQHKVILRNLD